MGPGSRLQSAVYRRNQRGDVHQIPHGWHAAFGGSGRSTLAGVRHHHVDEAHERSLNIDFLLGQLRQLSNRRPDLKIVITSATIDTAAFSAAFGNAPVIKVEGRTYPVEVIYAPLDSFGSDVDPASGDAAEKAEALHYIDGAVEAVERICRKAALAISWFSCPASGTSGTPAIFWKAATAEAANWCRSLAG